MVNKIIGIATLLLVIISAIAVVNARAEINKNLTVVEIESNEESPVVIHPAGGLEVREYVLPFNCILEKLGKAPVKS